jgi:non-specific serine/threonine protein kinase/serine/threonine-protein kinase
VNIPPELWRRVRPLLDEALALPVEDRAAFVAGACGQDDELRRALERLIAAAEDESTLAGHVAGQAAAILAGPQPEEAIGRRLGPYRLVRLLGTGGMGAVYLARRDDGEFEQQVAIKLVRSGPLVAEAVERFRRERQILAWLNHPNIARLLDGGVADAEPYLVMEYVEGQPIDVHCRERSLDLRDRIRLFLSVCEALTYAHANLVVHRDLKPGNVLVTPHGSVKVLDFGIARLVHDESGDAAIPGVAAPLTRAYASPEQLRHGPLSTASDVYSLGVVLYELLTGRLPHDRGAGGPDADEAGCLAPVRPSAVTPALRGDLEAILLRALAANPGDRYPSPQSLADDLRRALGHRPVVARAGGPAYRVSRFVRRHAVGVGATALILAAGTAGYVATSYEGARAQRRFENVRELSNALLFDLHEAVRLLPGATETRKRLVSHALTYLDELRREAPADSGLLLDLASAYEQVAEVQGNPHRTNLGDLQGALASYGEALALRHEVWRRDPASPLSRHALGRSYGHLAVVTSWAGRNGEAIALTRQGIDLLGALDAETPSAEVAIDLGRLESELGWWLIWAGQKHQGLEHIRSGISLLEPLLAGDAADASAAIDLWRAYSYEVDGLRFTERSVEALARLESTGLPYLRSVERVHGAHSDVQYELSIGLSIAGLLLEGAGRRDEAAGAQRQAQQTAEALLDRDPANQKALEALVRANSALGHLLADNGQIDEAVLALQSGVDIARRLQGRAPQNAELLNLLGNSERRLCASLVKARRAADGLGACLAAERALERAIAAMDQSPIVQSNLATALVWTARAYRALADGAVGEEASAHVANARQRYERALVLLRGLGDDAAPEIDPEVAERELSELGPRL